MDMLLEAPVTPTVAIEVDGCQRKPPPTFSGTVGKFTTVAWCARALGGGRIALVEAFNSTISSLTEAEEELFVRSFG